MPIKNPTSYKNLRNITLLSLLCSPLTAMASAANNDFSGWNWSGEIGTLNIDSTVADQQYIEDSATLFGFAAERYSNNSDFTFTMGLDFISYDDNNSFVQNTTDGYKSSDASAMLIFAEFGPKVRFGEDNMNYFIAHGGVSHVFGSERSVAFCSDCDSQKIDVDGGFYGILGVGHSFNSFDLDLQFQQYFTGDFDDSLRLKLSFSF